MRIVAQASRVVGDARVAPFRAAGVQLILAADDLVEQVRAARPQLVIVADDAEHDGFARCDEVRREGAPRVVLALDRAPEEVPFERVAGAGCDELVLARIPGEELYPAAARLCGLPDFSLAAPVEVRDPSWSHPSVPRRALAANLGPRSLDLVCERPLSTGGRVLMTLRRNAESSPLELAGEVARVDGGGGRPFRARVLFGDMSSAARQQLHDLASWESSPVGDILRVEVRGAFDQASDFSGLHEHIESRAPRLCVFDLSRIRQITSWGARAWILFLRGLTVEYAFANGSTLFSRHCSMVADMLGRGRVLSFALPYECGGCGAERARVVHAAWLDSAVRADPPPFRCPSCGGVERFAELPERYFSFLAT